MRNSIIHLCLSSSGRYISAGQKKAAAELARWRRYYAEKGGRVCVGMCPCVIHRKIKKKVAWPT